MNKWLLFAVLAVITAALDLGTKWYAKDVLPVRPVAAGVTTCQLPDDVVERRCAGVPVSVVTDYWDWVLSFNTGAAFSFLGSHGSGRTILTVVGVVAIGFLLVMVRKARSDQRALLWGLGMVMGGAVGNLSDRILHGSVTDFVLWRYHDKSWPVFNVADVVLVIGIGLLFIDSHYEKKREKALKTTAQAKTSA